MYRSGASGPSLRHAASATRQADADKIRKVPPHQLAYRVRRDAEALRDMIVRGLPDDEVTQAADLRRRQRDGFLAASEVYHRHLIAPTKRGAAGNGLDVDAESGDLDAKPGCDHGERGLEGVWPFTASPDAGPALIVGDGLATRLVEDV